MLNPADCASKTPRAGTGAPSCGKSSRGKGLTQGHRARYRRADKTSRKGSATFHPLGSVLYIPSCCWVVALPLPECDDSPS